jgi:hypothetical protein
MKRLLSYAALSVAFGLLSGLPVAAAADIVFTDGEADLNFHYDSATSTWHTVFHAHDETTATGLDDNFLGYPGIVGNEPDEDFNFDTLTTEIVTSTSLSIGLNNFLISSAEGSPIFEGVTAGQVNQFDSFNLTLDVANSTYNGNPLGASGQHVGLFNWDAFDNPVAQINSSVALLTANFGNFNHHHRHWGFTAYGTYDLAFNIAGVGGLYGDSAPSGSFNATFNVVPEPSALLLLSLSVGCLAIRRQRR